MTTTLPYANSIPHVGHAIEFYQADAYARFFRNKLGKENVFFNVGVDEHGLKLYNTALKSGKSPQEFLNDLVPKWIDFCRKFNISYDNFYRTSCEDHHHGAKRIWDLCNNRNDIYKKHYEGFYCIGCEAFILERDLINGKCPDHGGIPIWQSEENYFFRLSKYSKPILNYLNENPDFIKPSWKIQELVNFLNNLEDISISRSKSNLPWGIKVPNDPSQTMYVWFDALTNYIRAIGFDFDLNRFNQWWPGIQLCGPDNLRFQGAIWQGMLASLGLQFTKNILVHGTILGPDNQKMSKTLGNVVSPLEQFDKYGSDICRFYMLGGLRTYTDSSYHEDDLKALYNSHLANNYGNLLNRLIHLVISKDIDILNESLVESEFKSRIEDWKNRIEHFYIEYELFDAIATIIEMITYGNKYFHDNEPWKLDKPKASVILNNVSYLTQVATYLLEPIIPEGANKALIAIKKKEKTILYPKL